MPCLGTFGYWVTSVPSRQWDDELPVPSFVLHGAPVKSKTYRLARMIFVFWGYAGVTL